jgi:hypothetical protein
MKKKWMWVVVNVALVLVIVAIIIATWMPAIYTSDWFKRTFAKL